MTTFGTYLASRGVAPIIWFLRRVP
jgi:hypothetical protein